MQTPWVEVVETPAFLRAADKLIPSAERDELIRFLARNPKAGDVIPATGGIRKLRWALQGKGKRGGARIVYYYRNERLPLFLIAAYGKSQQDDLTPEQLRAVRAFAARL